jgi:hypothetical protein
MKTSDEMAWAVEQRGEMSSAYTPAKRREADLRGAPHRCRRMTRFGHQRPAYGPGADPASALYFEGCTAEALRSAQLRGANLLLIMWLR